MRETPAQTQPSVPMESCGVQHWGCQERLPQRLCQCRQEHRKRYAAPAPRHCRPVSFSEELAPPPDAAAPPAAPPAAPGRRLAPQASSPPAVPPRSATLVLRRVPRPRTRGRSSRPRRRPAPAARPATAARPRAAALRPTRSSPRARRPTTRTRAQSRRPRWPSPSGPPAPAAQQQAERRALPPWHQGPRGWTLARVAAAAGRPSRGRAAATARALAAPGRRRPPGGRGTAAVASKAKALAVAPRRDSVHRKCCRACSPC